jgi:hypothetical protein
VTAAVEEARRDVQTDSVTFAFGDVSTALYGLFRLGLSGTGTGQRQGSALAILYSGGEPVAARARGALAVAEDAGWEVLELAGLRATIEAPLDRWRLSFDGGDGHGAELEFAALGDVAELGPDTAAARLGGMTGYDQPCRVRGTVRVAGRSRSIDALGQRGHSWGEADWARIALVRTVTAWTDARCTTVTTIRPAGAHDHSADETWAALWEPEAVLDVERCRLSTTYDAGGRTRRAGLELWATDAEWPRRAAGELLCGSSLELGSLQLDCAFFRWHLEGQAGVGRYDILRRAG